MYDPRAYWEERARRQGEAYAGSALDADLQARAFSEQLWRSQLPNDAVLDLGCGPGRFAEQLSWDARRYVGADVNRVALQLLRERLPSIETRELLPGAKLPFYGGEFDVAYAVTVLQHVPETEIARVCRELARVASRVVLIEDANPERAAPASHMTFRDPNRYQELLGLRGGAYRLFDAERSGSHWLCEFV